MVQGALQLSRSYQPRNHNGSHNQKGCPMTDEQSTPFRVVVTYRADSGRNPIEQSFNCDTLDQMWQTVGRYRGMPSVRRVRVWAQLSVFEVTQS